MKKLLLLSIFALLIAGCSKMEEKKPGMDKNKTTTQDQMDPNTKMPPNHPDVNQNTEGNMTDAAGDDAKDPKADELSKGAYDFENTYKKDNNLKKDLITKHMSAGNYLMFEANLSPKKKYKPALMHYRRVLELDPSNAEAQRNKAQIEEIYTSMGRPIPQD
ncbi:MAG: hypothetical protein WC139_09445 [Candidatus Kapaibacterium sp.]